MAKLVIGTNKQTVVPAVVRDKSPAHYIEKTVDANGKLVNSNTMIDLTGVTDIGDNVLEYEHTGVAFPNNTTVTFDNLTTISGTSACQGTFKNTRNIVKASLSSLTTITGTSACKEMFSSNLLSEMVIDLSLLTTISGYQACQYMFSSPYKKIADLSSLTTISGSGACDSMFASASSGSTFDLSSLTTISGSSACNSMFSGALISSIEFPFLTTISASYVFSNMFKNCSQLVTVKMNKLDTITYPLTSSASAAVFGGCSNMERLELGGLKASTFSNLQTQLRYLFNSTTGSQAVNGCTVHFPSNFDPSDPNHTFDVSTLTGYPTFGGSASYIHVAFDLPATE